MNTYDGDGVQLYSVKNSTIDESPRWFSEQTRDFGHRKCLNGVGPIPSRVVFVDKMPTEREVWSKKPYSSNTAQFLLKTLRNIGFNINTARFTYMLHHVPKKYNASEVHWGERMFKEELDEVNPEIVVCLGAEPLKAVVGTSYRFDDIHGAFIRPDSIEDCPFLVFSTYSLEQVIANPKFDKFFIRDLECVKNKLLGTEVPEPRCDNAVIHTPEELNSFTNWITKKDRPFICLDCEWHGKNWMDPDRYFRTIQLGYQKGKVVTLEVSKEGGERCYNDEKQLFLALKQLLEHPKVKLAGHNIIADGEWLLSYGVDIRNNVKYDTMLAEHLIDQNGPFGLEELSMKYTPYGRYSTDVEVWVRRHKGEKLKDSTKDGYGYVPWSMLKAYGYKDVDCLWYIMEKQIPILKERGCLSLRGPNMEYPSLLDSVMRTQRVTYDLEMNGLPVDMKQLDMLTEKYQSAKAESLAKVMQLSRAIGYEDFNPRSSQHLRKILFDKRYLGLIPIKTTNGDDWGRIAGEMGMDDETSISASTDKTTLQILEGKHPFIAELLNFRRVDQACKTWLTKEKDGKPAGLYAQIWPDGTLKPRFSPLTESGRFRTAMPNSQNFPKKAEGYVTKIFGKGNEPPLLRTIVDPNKREDYLKKGLKVVQLECDFCQAEMFVAANVTGDENMLKALTTPGLDLHDKTAVDSFGLHMFAEDGREVSEDYLVELAASLKDDGGDESEEFQHFMKTLTYVGKNGEKMSRSEFKSTLRVASKAINFGVMYGRGSRAISMQIKADTGDTRTVDEIDIVTAEGLKNWKTVAYPHLWDTLQSWGQRLYNEGYVENPWGRRKYGYVRKGEKNASLERQFSNFPIQSTVADTVQIAMDKMRVFIENTQLPFKIQNQIHDAVMVEAPIEYIPQVKQMFQETMAGIKIPLPNGRWFTLDVDIDVYERWGVKMKE